MLAWSRQLPAVLVVALGLSACGGGGSTTPHVSSTPTGNGAPPGTGSGGGSGPVDEAAFKCPTSDSVTAAGRSGSSTLGETRRAPLRSTRSTQQPSGLIAVTYDRTTLATAQTAVALREQSLGANLVRTLDFKHLGTTMRVLAVPPAKAAGIAAALRSEPGVRSVGAAGQRRSPLRVNAPYFTNDPYFTGFQQTVPVNGVTPAPTYEQGPYEESSSVPGQWGMHAMQLEHAFAYSQPNNGSGITNGNALGSANVKIAIIDSGADTTHPELSSKITYQKCFITSPGTNGASGTQSTSNFVTDEDGHGTDVAGIAAADSGNNLGFAGAGGNSVIYDYRVLPTPDDNCANPGSTDQQCTSNTADIASAINDAVANNVNVISMSLGGDNCTNGQDPAPDEGAAVANAIAAGIVVVAASGNDAKPGGSAPVDAPACDSGVIAAGATALADGQPNGDLNSNGGPPPNSIEYVASYSNSGSPGALLRSPAAWGIVAPGGDPSSADENSNSTDFLHWITDIWTSTPFDQKNFGGDCIPDYPGTGSTTDCQILIAGTSMSAPAVAGAAALILGVNSTYQSPGAMKNLLCSTADDLSGDPREGCGRLNVYRAMATALHDPQPPT